MTWPRTCKRDAARRALQGPSKTAGPHAFLPCSRIAAPAAWAPARLRRLSKVGAAMEEAAPDQGSLSSASFGTLARVS